jgi:V8-like Glu-specific endopeptidase
MGLVLQDRNRLPYVAQVEIFFPRLGGRAALGSATLIHPRLLLTAGHVVYDPSRGNYPDAVRVNLGGTTRVSRTSRTFYTTEQWVGSDSSTMNPTSAFDVGAILLDPSDHIDTAEVPSAVPASVPGPDLAGLMLNVAGFPAEQPLFDGPVTLGELYGSNSFPQVADPPIKSQRVLYLITTLGGMSGGPVYTIEPGGGITVRGVHTSTYEGYGCGLWITDDILANLIQPWLAIADGQ